MRSARWFLPALLLIAVPASFASAHRLKAFGFAEGTAIHGSVYFSGNVAAQGVRIQVFDPDGALLAETTSDDDGRFTITAGRRVDHRIVADSGDGHRAEYVVPAHELPPALPGLATSVPSGAAPADLPASAVGSTRPSSAETEEMIERAVARQVGPLREQLDEFADQVRWRRGGRPGLHPRHHRHRLLADRPPQSTTMSGGSRPVAVLSARMSAAWSHRRQSRPALPG